MPQIDIRRNHRLLPEDARMAVEKAVAAIGSRLRLESRWQDDTLRFARPGVSGAVRVGSNEVRVTAELGFPYGLLKPMIEREIESRLGQSLA